MRLGRRLRYFWYDLDKEALAFVAIIASIAAGFVFGLKAVFAHREEARARAMEQHRQSLACLARNIYHEARGEPLEGQYAVAEVTLNRVASRRFPHSVCEVVHQKNWDPIRRRYVGAFSWTEFETLAEPRGEDWERARHIAEVVYYGRQAPVARGALFYHADYIKPAWAAEKRLLTKIGRHIFYK